MIDTRYADEAEKSVVGAMLTRPKVVPEVVGTLLQPAHFRLKGLRVLFDAIVDSYYADDSIDPLTIAERCAADLGGEKDGALEYVRSFTAHPNPQEGIAHAAIVKREYDRRSLVEMARDLLAQAEAGEQPPEQIASVAAQRAMEICTSRILSNEILTYAELGKRFIQRQRELMAAVAAGIETGVKFHWDFLDGRLHGLKPGDLWIIGGEPGVGKSGLAWCAAKSFATGQIKKPEDKRIGTFVLSLEMGEEPSSDRLAANAGHVDSSTLREGVTTEDELARIIKEWGAVKEAPLYFNFTSMLRASQLRALVVEAIRRYNVGLVVIDHMRYFNADERYDSAADEDEAKARFLKESIAKDLNVAVMLLAHTTKAIENNDDRRPRLSHLRGGGMVAAHADFVSFVYAPFMHAREEDILDGKVERTDAELIWGKNRHSLTDTSYFHFDASIMYCRDQMM